MTAPAFVGLSGAMASGKTEVLNAFERLGAATLSTDAVTHEILQEPETVDRLVERWGESVAPGGRVDRARIGEIVFSSPEDLQWLESLLHPLVGQRVVEWRDALDGESEIAVVEVPLLFESGMDSFFDATLVVVAGEERRGRWADERGIGAAQGRSARQWTEDEKAARATFVIRNDGDLQDLEEAVRDLWPRLVAARPAA